MLTNPTWPGPAQTTSGQQTLDAADEFLEIDVRGMAVVSVTLSGTFTVGAITVKLSNNAFAVLPDSAYFLESSYAGGWFQIATSQFYEGMNLSIPCMGFETLRLTASNPFTGSVVLDWAMTAIPQTIQIGGPVTLFAAGYALADAETNTPRRLSIATQLLPIDQVVRELIYNGNTWDRVRSAEAAQNTAGTGLLGAGNLVWDGAVWQRWRGNPETAFGKTPSSFVLAQGAAGTTVIAAASPSNKHKVLGAVLTIDAGGTVKFIDGSGDLTGAMPVSANSGFVIPASLVPMIETSVANSALSIVTTGGAAKGVVRYLTEP